MPNIDLQTINNQLRYMVDIHDVTEYLGQISTQMLNCNGYVINLWNQDNNCLKMTSMCLPGPYEQVEHIYHNYRINKNEVDPNISVFFNRTSQLFKNPDEIPAESSTHSCYQHWLMKELLISPIANNNECIGTIMLFSTKNQLDIARSEDLIEILSLFTPYISRTPNMDEACIHSQTIQSLLQMTDDFINIISTVDTSDILEVNKEIVGYLINIVNMDLGTLCIVENNHLRAIPSIARSDEFSQYKKTHDQYIADKRVPLRLNASANATCLLQNSIVHLNDISRIIHLPMSDFDRSFAKHLPDLKSVVIIPVALDDTPICTIGMLKFRECADLEDHQLQLINNLCEIAGGTIFSTLLKQ